MAVGDTVAILTPHQNDPPSSSFGTLDTVTNKLVVDLAVGESVEIGTLMPQHYGGGNLQAFIHYAMSSATSGNVQFRVSIWRIADATATQTESYGTTVSTGDVAVPGTAQLKDVTSTTHDSAAERDSLAVGEEYYTKVERIAATSEASGDVEFRKVEWREVA